MKDIRYITRAFVTKLTPLQLNEAIRLGALLHGGEVEFSGKPGIDARLIIRCSELAHLFIVKYGKNSVEFQFASPDLSMFRCVRGILDENLISEMHLNLLVQAPSESLGISRIGA